MVHVNVPASIRVPHALVMAFEMAYQEVGVHKLFAAAHSIFLATDAGAFGSCGMGGDDHISYLFSISDDEQSKDFWIFPKSKRSLMRDLILTKTNIGVTNGKSHSVHA